MDKIEIYKGFEIRAFEREQSRWRAEIRKADGSTLKTLVGDSGHRVSITTSADTLTAETSIDEVKKAIDPSADHNFFITKHSCSPGIRVIKSGPLWPESCGPDLSSPSPTMPTEVGVCIFRKQLWPSVGVPKKAELSHRIMNRIDLDQVGTRCVV